MRHLFIFDYFRARRARSVVLNTLPSLPESVRLLSPVDRAATLAIANAMILVAADTWGTAAKSNPSSLKRKATAEMVMVLAAHHITLVRERLEPMQKRNMQDIAYSQAMREIRATELLICTMGASLVEGRKPGVAESWKLLIEARAHAVEGAKALAAFARHAKVPPLPQSKTIGKKLSGEILVKLASSPPPFLARKKPRAATGRAEAKA